MSTAKPIRLSPRQAKIAQAFHRYGIKGGWKGGFLAGLACGVGVSMLIAMGMLIYSSI